MTSGGSSEGNRREVSFPALRVFVSYCPFTFSASKLVHRVAQQFLLCSVAFLDNLFLAVSEKLIMTYSVIAECIDQL